MSASGQPSVGQQLREARAAGGITVDEAALRLRLMHRQIEAMEADDFESLGRPVFARGFVRNYARLLGLAAEPLLAQMDGAPAEPAVAVAEAPSPARAWLTAPWLILLLLLAALAVVAVPVALYWWLNSEVEDAVDAPAPPAVLATPAPAPSVATPAPVAAPEAAPATAEPVETAVAAAPDPVARSVLHFEFGDDAWVEIKDGSGRTVHRQLNRAGSSADVSGQPPFNLVVGNAAQVRLSYNGRAIDLKPFIDVTVARFTLEE